MTNREKPYSAQQMARDLREYYARQAQQPEHGTHCDCENCERQRLRDADQRA